MRRHTTIAPALLPASHGVWLKYCVASRGLAIIVAEQSAEAFPPYHGTCVATNDPLMHDQLVVEPLMIALRMVGPE